jgi:hypothetical protein
MKRIITVAAMLAAFALAGCGQKTEQAAKTGSDSLLASNPVEPPQGNLTPSTQFQGGSAGQGTTSPANPEKPRSAPAEKPAKKPASAPKPAAEKPGVMVPAGTAFSVEVGAKITSETAAVGDAWTGTIKDPVVIGTSAPFPAGSTVNGTVAAVKPAQKGDRALLVLSIGSITVGGKSITIAADSDSMIAGSTRARNVGAVAGGAAAGALIGKAIGGGKGALIGGLLGGGAAAGGAAASKGYQVTVDEGAAIKFHVRHDTTIRD